MQASRSIAIAHAWPSYRRSADTSDGCGRRPVRRARPRASAARELASVRVDAVLGARRNRGARPSGVKRNAAVSAPPTGAAGRHRSRRRCRRRPARAPAIAERQRRRHLRPGRGAPTPAASMLRPATLARTRSPVAKPDCSASPGRACSALSQVSLVNGRGSSCSQPLLAKRPSSTAGSTANTAVKAEAPADGDVVGNGGGAACNASADTALPSTTPRCRLARQKASKIARRRRRAIDVATSW